jgi:arginase family enzyme
MESIFDWVEPTEAGLFDISDGVDRLRDVLRIHRSGERPDLEGCVAALVGVMDRRGSADGAETDRAAEWVRSKLYALTVMDRVAPVADIGNISAGQRPEDTMAALDVVCQELMSRGIIPVVIGGAHSLTYPMYKAFAPQKRPINVSVIDAEIDFGGDPQQTDGSNWLNQLILPEGGHLFDLSTLGHQRYLVDGDSLQLMAKMHFDNVRLGMLRSNLTAAEPILRDSDLVSFDLGSVRTSDHPASPKVHPNGLTGEEFCQLARYAGYSDRLSAVGFFEHDPSRDGDGRGGQLVAEAIWCFLEGVMHRMKDHPRGPIDDYLQYRVVLEDEDHEVVFYKSPRSDRWWMDIPTPGSGNRKGRILLVPCSYEEYQAAASGQLPDRWWRTQQKLS